MRRLSKNTWLTSCSPEMLMIGRTVRPGASMGVSRKLIPACGLPSVAVRTSRNIQLAKWAWVVQIFEPLTT